MVQEGGSSSDEYSLIVDAAIKGAPALVKLVGDLRREIRGFPNDGQRHWRFPYGFGCDHSRELATINEALADLVSAVRELDDADIAQVEYWRELETSLPSLMRIIVVPASYLVPAQAANWDHIATAWKNVRESLESTVYEFSDIYSSREFHRPMLTYKRPGTSAAVQLDWVAEYRELEARCQQAVDTKDANMLTVSLDHMDELTYRVWRMAVRGLRGTLNALRQELRTINSASGGLN